MRVIIDLEAPGTLGAIRNGVGWALYAEDGRPITLNAEGVRRIDVDGLAEGAVLDRLATRVLEDLAAIGEPA